MKCDRLMCGKEAITFHGIFATTHGYCEEHRCCAKCGLKINSEKESVSPSCKCEKPTERKDYLNWKKTQI